MPRETEQAKDELMRAGYLVKTCSEYHLQVKKPDNTTIVNVWPTAKKILKEFTAGPAPHYEDVVEAIKPLLEKETRQTLKQLAAKLRALYPTKPPDALLCWWREDPMKRLPQYIQKIK